MKDKDRKLRKDKQREYSRTYRIRQGRIPRVIRPLEVFKEGDRVWKKVGYFFRGKVYIIKRIYADTKFIELNGFNDELFMENELRKA